MQNFNDNAVTDLPENLRQAVALVAAALKRLRDAEQRGESNVNGEGVVAV